ncbi:alpha/beta fold hydrolase [Micromonospora radicis]|nr:alpha/beta hydrolase [Micromonospora radicis]
MAEHASGIRYHVYGQGQRGTFLLVHGWCGDHTFMAPLAEHLAAARARVIAVDMPGHGQSPPPPDGYGVDQMAGRLRALARELGLRRVTVIGHSLGGVWSLAAAAADPAVFTGLGLLDSAVAGAPGAAEAIAQVAGMLRDDSTGAAREQIVRSYFRPYSDPALVASVLRAMARPSTEAAYEPIAGLADYVARGGDTAALTAWRRPLLLIGTDAPFADYAHLSRLVPAAHVGQTVGSGHFMQLEVPAQVNEMVDRYLKVTG